MSRSRFIQPPPDDAVFEAQLLAKREIDENGCWLWTGYIGKGGYGIGYFSWQRWVLRISPHRAAYLLWKGEIAEGLEVHHCCHVRHCFNPEHLEAVTPSVNRRRRKRHNRHQGATHCIHGHEFVPENTRYDRKGARICVTCDRSRHQRYAAKKRAEQPSTPLVKPVGQSLKTHCKRGHEFTKENTYVCPTPTGLMRMCRECRREQQQRLRDARRHK